MVAIMVDIAAPVDLPRSADTGLRETGERPVIRDENAFCPKCGAEALVGYGLAGGGFGSYEYCTAKGCNWFHKIYEDD